MNNNKSLGAIELLELIFKYLTEITTLKNHDEIIDILANMGRALTSADRCSVWIVGEDKKSVWTKVAHGVNSIEIPIDSGIVGSAILKKEKILIEDVYDDPRFNQEIDKKTGYRTKSMIVIPLFDNENNIIGVFQAINRKNDTGIFDKRDMQRLTLASTYAAEALASARLVNEIEETQREVVFTMGTIGESRSKETGNHVKRVAEYSKILALAYGLSQEDAELLKQASPMHDIGKIAIPDAVLNKPGKFDRKERAIMDKHAELGYQMIKNSERPLLKAASIVAHEHHEKWDGTGYPRQLRGEDIHIFGRITAVADVFDALGSDRVYKKAWPDERTFELFRKERGKHFDPKLVDLFFENIEKIYKVRETFKDIFQDEYKEKSVEKNSIKVLGAFGTKAKGHGTSCFYLNKFNVIDAGNLLAGLEEKSVDLENIWITHAHLDHISDLAYVVDNYYFEMRKSIKIKALPATLKAIEKHFFNDVIWPDFSKIPLPNSQGMCIEYEAIELNTQYKVSDDEFIEAFKTDHTVPSCGYIYRKGNSSLLITSDTYEIENILDIVNKDNSISSMIVECSFPSSMGKLAKESKHLTPKLLAQKLKALKRENLKIYINHIKPSFLEEMKMEIEEYCANWKPKILKDNEILNF